MNNNAKYHCDICGRPLKKKNRAYGYTLCMKHMHQYIKYHRFLDNNPRTQNDLNEFRTYDKNTIEFDCYDVKQNVVGHFYIDKEDLPKVRYHKWKMDTNNRIITGNCTKSKPRKELSRLILNINDSNMIVDHINGDSTDNTKQNLRVCTQQENLCNKHFMSNNTSGLIGIPWDKNRRRWAPEIQYKNKRAHLGRYKDIKEAQFVKCIAEKILFKEFQAFPNQTFDTIKMERQTELQRYVENKINKCFGN